MLEDALKRCRLIRFSYPSSYFSPYLIALNIILSNIGMGIRVKERKLSTAQKINKVWDLFKKDDFIGTGPLSQVVKSLESEIVELFQAKATTNKIFPLVEELSDVSIISYHINQRKGSSIFTEHSLPMFFYLPHHFYPSDNGLINEIAFISAFKQVVRRYNVIGREHFMRRKSYQLQLNYWNPELAKVMKEKEGFDPYKILSPIFQASPEELHQFHKHAISTLTN